MKLIFGTHICPYELRTFRTDKDPVMNAFLKDYSSCLTLISPLQIVKKVCITNKNNALINLMDWAKSPEISREKYCRILYANKTYYPNEWTLINLSNFMSTNYYRDLANSSLQNREEVLSKIVSHITSENRIGQLVWLQSCYEFVTISHPLIKTENITFSDDVMTDDKNLNHKVITYFKTNPHLLRSLQLLHISKKPESNNAQKNDAGYMPVAHHLCKVNDFNGIFSLDKADGYFALFVQDFYFFLSLFFNPSFNPKKHFTYPPKYKQRNYYNMLTGTANWLISNQFCKLINADPMTKYLLEYQWDRMLLLRWQFHLLNDRTKIIYNLPNELLCDFYQLYEKTVTDLTIDDLWRLLIQNKDSTQSSLLQINFNSEIQYFTLEKKDMLINLPFCKKSTRLYQKLVACIKPILSSKDYDYSL